VNLEPRAPVEIEARLLPVVETLLCKNGYVGLNIREIAKEIGMGPATIYRYFLSKEGLALRIVQDQDREIAKAVGPAIQAGGSDYDKWTRTLSSPLFRISRCRPTPGSCPRTNGR